MTTGQFVTDANLTLLGNIDLSHLQNTWGQLITDADGKLATLQLGIKQLVFAQVVHDELLDEHILVLVASPAVRLDAVIF